MTLTPTAQRSMKSLAHVRREAAAAEFSHARTKPRVLRAAGIRIERMSSERLRAIAGQQQRWQTLAWGYRDMIGELRAALQFRAQAISRVRFYVAEIQDDDDEPIALALRDEKDKDGQPTERAGKVTLPADICRAAEAELARLPLDDSDFIGIFSENFDVAGECWLYGYEDPTTGDEVWEIRSIYDVDVQGDGVTIRDETGQPRRVNLDPDSGEELYRLWRKHPAKPYQPDSSLNACLDSLEDITLIARELRAASRSRIAANGIAMFPEGMAELKNTKDDDDTEPGERFVADLTAAIVAPISNEGDAGAIAPIVLLGSREDIQAVRFERLEREDSPTLIDKLNKALARMGQSIEVPPEIITGMADVNHWTAWQIDMSTFRYYLEPGIRLMADSLTHCFLRRALQSFPSEQVRKIRIWFDAGAITENPNRRQDTLDALDRTLISPRTGRKELGFGEGDAPTPEEILQMIAAKQGFDAAAATQVLAYYAAQQGAEIPEGMDEPAAPAPRGLPPGQPVAQPDETGVGGTGAPDTAPPGLNAGGWQYVGESPRGTKIWRGPTGALKTETGQNLAAHWQGDVADLWSSANQTVTLEACGTVDKRLFELLSGEQRPGDVVTAAAPTVSDIPLWKLDSLLGLKLAEIERALRDQILLAADAALTRALQRAGNRLRSKTQKDPELFAQLRARPSVEWAMVMGRQQAFALGADLRYLLREAFTDLGEKFTQWTTRAIRAMVNRILAFLGVDANTAAGRTTADRVYQAMSTRVPDAWARLEAQLEQHAERLMFDGQGEPLADGEQTDLAVPPDLVRQALAIVGGLPETAAGIDQNGRIPTGEAFTGMADGVTVTQELAAHGVVEFGREWKYNPELERDTFVPHYDLDGVRFTSWTDPVLETPLEYAWVGKYFRPKDHQGCLCTTSVTYAVPDQSGRDAFERVVDETQPDTIFTSGREGWETALADQLRERLRQPSQDMAYILELAADDDRAGRRFTTAQQTRDQWLEVQRLNKQFLNGE